MDLLSKKLLEQLQALKCHLLGNQEEPWLRQVLFSSTEIHYQFLKWILYSFDEDLGKTLKNADFLSLSIEEKQKHLHYVCCSLGICGRDDLNIIDGTAQKELLVEFWELLLSLHLTHSQKLQGSGDQDELQLPGNLSGICKLDNSDSSDQIKNTKSSGEMVRESLSWKLLPPDLEHEVREMSKLHSKKSPVRKDLMEMASSEERSLEENGNPGEESDVSQGKLRDLHEQVISNMHNLQGMVSGFQDCHQRLQPWLKKNVTKSGANELEGLVITAAEKMALLQKMLDEIDFESRNKDLLETISKDKTSYENEKTDNSKVLKVLKDTLNSAS